MNMRLRAPATALVLLCARWAYTQSRGSAKLFAAVTLFFVGGLGVSAPAVASDVQFVGNVAYTYVGNVATLTADRVQNFDSFGYSGTLHMELWALPAPYSGSFTTGYKLAQYTLGQLTAGYYYYNITSGAVLFVPPPNGVWYVAMMLTEYTGGIIDNGYTPVDFVNFSTPLIVGPPTPPPPTTAQAIEYHHAAFGHYFVTAFADEVSKLDAGVFVGWARTGQSFNVYRLGAGGNANVCRFFSTSFAPKSSHFYTPFAGECAIAKGNPNWQIEAEVFSVTLPNSIGGCPGGTQALYRLYNNGQGAAPNHRYTTSLTTRSAMLAQGWIPEGSGTVGVIACVPM